jgi:hypothetical protein
VSDPKLAEDGGGEIVQAMFADLRREYPQLNAM